MSKLKNAFLSVVAGSALFISATAGAGPLPVVENLSPPPEPISGLLAGADIKKGRQIVAANCVACHSFGKSADDKIGPDLVGVFDRPRASSPRFNFYSDALKNKGGKWTEEELAAWIYAPDAFAPGTSMVFEGLKKASDRAAVVKFLKTFGK